MHKLMIITMCLATEFKILHTVWPQSGIRIHWDECNCSQFWTMFLNCGTSLLVLIRMTGRAAWSTLLLKDSTKMEDYAYHPTNIMAVDAFQQQPTIKCYKKHGILTEIRWLTKSYVSDVFGNTSVGSLQFLWWFFVAEQHLWCLLVLSPSLLELLHPL